MEYRCQVHYSVVCGRFVACMQQYGIHDRAERVSAHEYEMKDLGEAKFVLGIEIERDRARRVIYLNQQQYIDNVLERFNMSECKRASTPMDVSVRLTKSQAPATDKEKQEVASIPYQSAVGSLMYAMT